MRSSSSSDCTHFATSLSDSSFETRRLTAVALSGTSSNSSALDAPSRERALKAGLSSLRNASMSTFFAIRKTQKRKLPVAGSNVPKTRHARHHTSCTTSPGSTHWRSSGRMRSSAQVYSDGAMRS